MVQLDHATASRWLHGASFAGYYWLTGRGYVLQYVDRLEELYRASRPEIETHVRQSTCRLLTHASRTVPYYRDLMGGETPTEATALSVLRTLPILTKDIIRKESPRLLSERPGKGPKLNRSSGSTGEPIQLLQDVDMKRLSRASKLLFMRWAGYRPGEPHLMIWGVPVDEKPCWRERLFRAAHQQTHLDCFLINDDLLHGWVERINAVRPALLEGYSDALYELAQYVLDNDLEVASPNGIITGASVLTAPMRETIRTAFRCPVLNRYGSREVSDVACSCRESPELHVNELTSYLEIVDEQGQPCEPGVEGDILVTLLTNCTMPLIRYRIEDRGAWASGPCVCGRNTVRLVEVSGRRNDYLLAADGTKVNGVILTALLSWARGIRRYQFHQTQRDRVTVAVVPMQGVSAEAVRKYTAETIEPLTALLKGVPVEVAVVDDIPPARSGKHRYVVNDLVSG